MNTLPHSVGTGLFLLCLTATAVAAEPAVPDEAAARAAMASAAREAEGRWASLFNGRNLAGWSVKCVAADTNKVYWRVEDGVIVVDSTADPKHDYVWLVADGEYGDFLLRLRFQPFRGVPGNSGVQIRSRFDDAAGWLDGPQVDIHPPGPWRTGFIYDETRGVRKWIAPALAKVSDARPEMAPAGVPFHYADDPEVWNDLRILARGTRVTVELNGRIVRDADLKGVLDDAVHRERATGLRGRIALQLHARDALKMCFKDIEVAERVGRDAGAASAPSAPPFRFLRVGEVQPRGWLLDQIRMDATNGYGPVMDRLTDRIELPVFDSRSKSALVTPKIGADWWNGETTGNWLDGLIRTAYLSGDAGAQRQADDLVGRILSMRDEDGYLGIYPRSGRFESPIGVQNGELWSQACLFRGLLAYHELTGRADVLDAVRRAAKLMISKYGPARPYWRDRIGRGGPGHNLMFVDVCEWMNRLSPDPAYVAFARFLYDGYCVPEDVRESDVQLRNLSDPAKPFHGHGAHVMEHLRIPLFLAAATGDTRYRAAADNVFPKSVRHLSAGGACISDEDIGGRPGDPAIGCEYCTMLEFLHTLQSGVEKSGRADMADAIEGMAFNSAQGARRRDGRAIQYCTMDNQARATRQGAGGRFKLSPTHDDVAVCCPTTALKFFPYFAGQLWMTTAAGDGLVAVNYAPSLLKTRLGGVDVEVSSETGYPFEDEVRMTVTPGRPATFRLRLRVPGWAGGMRVEVPPGTAVREGSGWRDLLREWRPGDRVTVAFTPEVERRVMANGEAYLKRGPLVFALAIPSVATPVRTYPLEGFADYEYVPRGGAMPEYALAATGDFRCVRAAGVRTDPWSDSPVRLAGGLVDPQGGKTVDVELVPMGASLLRRVTFPDLAQIRRRRAEMARLKGDSNLALRAKAEASSSAKGYAAGAVADGVARGFPESVEAEWASKGETNGARVRLVWERPVAVGCVWLYDRPNPADHVAGAAVAFSDGSTVAAGELPNDGLSPARLSFPERTVTWIEVVVTRVGPRCRNAGFSEIAVFARDPPPVP